MKLKTILPIVIVSGSCILSSCDKEEYYTPSTGSKPSVLKPQISESITTTTTTDIDATFKVISNEEYPTVVFYYGTSNQATSNPVMNKHSTCSFREKAGKNTYYYRARHTGFRAGQHIYYYATATNSAGSTKTATYHRIFTRK